MTETEAIDARIMLLNLRQEEIRERMDELVNDYPALKARRRAPMAPSNMHVAVRSGFLVDEDGELREITRGVDRVATEILDRDPAYEDFFDRTVTTKRFGGGTRTEIRATDPRTGKARAIEFPPGGGSTPKPA